MAKKNSSKVTVTEVEENGNKTFALKDGESLITVKDYRNVQEKNAKLTRDLNDANMAKTAAEKDKAEMEKKLVNSENNKVISAKKANRNKIITAVVAVALGVGLFFAGLGIGRNSNVKNHDNCVAKDDYDKVVAELEEANATIDALRNDLDSLKKEVEDLNQEKKVTEAELAEAQARIDELEQQLETEYAANEALAAANEELRAELAEANANIAELLQEIADLEAQLRQMGNANVNNNQSQNNNGNVSVGNKDEEDVNNNNSNIKQDENDYEPFN